MGINQTVFLKNKWKARLHTTGLMLLMAAFVWILGNWILGQVFALYATLMIVAMLILNPALSPKILLRAYKAQAVTTAQAPELHQALLTLTERAGLPRKPDLYYLPIGTMNAFATGNENNPVIALSDGLLRNLSIEEIVGVLAHEISHIKHHDVLILTASDMMGQMIRLLAILGQCFVLLSLPFLLSGEMTLPWMPLILLMTAPLASALIQLAISRKREVLADASAASLMGTAQPLISALLRLDQQNSYWERFYRASSDNALLRTHPTTKERVSHLYEIDMPVEISWLTNLENWQNPWHTSGRKKPRRVSRFFWF